MRGRENPVQTLRSIGFVFIFFTLACSIGLTQQQPNVEATVAAGVQATQQGQINIQATIDVAVLGTQVARDTVSSDVPPTRTPASVGPTATPSTVSDSDAKAVIMSEVEAAINQDLERLQTLYTVDAVVVDHNKTPDDPSDNTVWQGWSNIERRYAAFFSVGFSSATLVDLTVQVDDNQAQGTHKGVILDGTLYEDTGIYTLEQRDGQWLITQLEYGKQEDGKSSPTVLGQDDGLYILGLGDQHRYEEPWGWDRGDPCIAWQTGNFDDTKPNYRGFNVELLLTNKSDTKVPDEWPITFTTARGQSVKACFYSYPDSGPPSEATSSVTFFTVVEVGDYVETITFTLHDHVIRLCLDGQGGAVHC